MIRRLALAATTGALLMFGASCDSHSWEQTRVLYGHGHGDAHGHGKAHGEKDAHHKAEGHGDEAKKKEAH